MKKDLSIAVIIPCYNEEITIKKTIHACQNAIPTASIYVYDNNSSDRTIQIAKSSGAIVRTENLQGKGNVVRRMFADVEADIYVMIDGDDTYDMTNTQELIDILICNNLDMLNGRRVANIKSAYRRGHRLGNRLLTNVVSMMFDNRFDDLLSGYRIFSRRFVKTFPAMARGFEIETELTVHAMELRMPVAEYDVNYSDRPEGSVSKLRTYQDGFRILKTIAVLVREERPMAFFGGAFILLVSLSLLLAWPVFSTYLETGLVPRFPTAILSTGLMLLGFLNLACGLILDTVTLGRRELKRISYLRYTAPNQTQR